MFPFLAPIRKPTNRLRVEATPEMFVEISFFTDSPLISRREPDVHIPPMKLNSRSVSGGSVSPRPKSRTSSRQGTSSSQPSSGRSMKSSPVPNLSSVPPPPTRHKNKGLETSTAMMELFGGDVSSFGSNACFERIPGILNQNKSFGRTNALDREYNQSSNVAVQVPSNSGPFFANVEDHEQSYTRAAKRRNGNQFSQSAQPGPEWEETHQILLSDGECPAERILREREERQMREVTEALRHHTTDEAGTPESSSDWKEAKENVLESVKTRELIPCEQGPDIVDEHEEVIVVDDEGRITQKVQPRRTSDDINGEESETQSAAQKEIADEQAETSQSHGYSGMSLLIRSAQVVNDDSIFVADVLIQNGTITQLAPSIEAPQDVTIIEATGRMLLPAGIDVHTNFSSPDVIDDLKIGSKAAVAGGTATVIDLVVPRDGESIVSALQRVKSVSEGVSCNVGLSILVRQWSDSVKKEMQKCVEEGVNSFSLDIEGDDKLFQALEFCKSLGVHVRILPENRSIISQLENQMLSLGITGAEGFLQSRPEELEKERASTFCLLSQITNCPISILSLSSAETATSIAKGRENGALVHAEVAVAAIGSDGTHYFNKCSQHSFNHITESPLRAEGNHASRLVQIMSSSPLCVCASGHRGVSSASRQGKDFTKQPRGVSAAEERMSLVWEKGVREGKMDAMRFVAVTSSNAAKIFNLYPRKGRIAVGADADVVLWDPIVKRKLASKESQSHTENSIFEGLTVHGCASITIVGGEIAWKEGVCGDAKGKFTSLNTHSPYLFSVVQMRDKGCPYEKVERTDSIAPSNGIVKSRYQNPFDNTPIRPAQRKTHNESSISFGNEAPQRARIPPGGVSKGLW